MTTEAAGTGAGTSGPPERAVGAALVALSRPGPPQPGHPGSARLIPHHPDVEAWVQHEFARIYLRRLTPTFRWCAQWWRHPEAVLRFTVLWRTWEVLRLEPALGIGVWYRDHLDRHLATLTAADGPFAGCSPDTHYPPAISVLPTTTPPPGWWDTDHPND